MNAGAACLSGLGKREVGETPQRGLWFALGMSVAAHLLVLAFGRGPQPELAPPRLLDARLVSESTPERPHDPPPRHPPAETRPVHAAPAPHPQRQEALPVPSRMVSDAVSSRPTPAIATSDSPLPSRSEAPAVAAPPAAAAVSSHAAYTPPSSSASYLDNPKPGYPMIARRRGLQGRVLLDVRVSAEGLALFVKVKESSGHDVLDEAAVNAVAHWRFAPARRGGEAVEGTASVPVQFRLNGTEPE